MFSTSLIFLAVVITTQLITSTSSAVKCNKELKSIFPAILVFGDSTVDTGNNNYIITAFKGNHPPYGQNFPGGVATGRFSNGKLVPDLMAAVVGIKEAVPPFLDPGLSDKDIVSGVSFASGGSGYDELTTSVSGVIPVSKQTEYLDKYVERLKGIVGEREGAWILSRAIVVVSAGTNDFIFNFYDLPSRRIQFSVGEYQDFLLSKLRNLVKKLYDVGCRKMVISGLPPIGCLPIQKSLKPGIIGSCIDKENEEAESYNHKLQKLLPQIEEELRGSRILYADAYNPLIDMIHNPHKYGFVETERGCCGTGLVEAGPLCTGLEPVCPNPQHYLFWDSIHPTESTYRILSDNFKSLIPKLLGSHNTTC